MTSKKRARPHTGNKVTITISKSIWTKLQYVKLRYTYPGMTETIEHLIKKEGDGDEILH